MTNRKSKRRRRSIPRHYFLALVVSGVCLRSSRLPIFGLRYYLSEQLEVLGPWPPENKHTTSVPVYFHPPSSPDFVFSFLFLPYSVEVYILRIDCRAECPDGSGY